MSGFEIAGVVLAAIPLIICAAEKYRDGLNGIDVMLHKDRVLQKYVIDLSIQVELFEALLKGFLAEVDIDVATKVELLEQPDSAQWTSPRILSKMVDACGSQGYLNKIVTLLKRMHDELSDRLDSGLTLVDFVQYHKSSGQAMNRVKFSWRSTRRNKMLLDMKETNRILEDLLRTREKAARFDRQLSAHKVATECEVCAPAQQLYDVFSQSCICACADVHEFRLGLKKSYHNPSTHNELSFEALIICSPNIPCETTIRVATGSPRQASPNVPRVTFTDESASHAVLQTRKELRDICEAISQAHDKNEKLELHIDHHCRLREFSRRSASLAQDYENVTLETMLADTRQYANRHWLKKEKAQLALKLAYSLLQLHGSAWLRRLWSRRCILFRRTRGASPEFTCLDRPYVASQLFPPSLRQANPALGAADDAGSGTQEIHSARHPVPSLFALGVILLELQLNGPITDRVTAAAQDMRWTALEVLEDCDKKGMLSAHYYMAVHACFELCLVSSFTERRSFDDINFRKWYCQQVIARLNDDITENYMISKDHFTTG